MDLDDVIDLAYEQMDAFDLHEKGWTFAFDNAQRRFGACHYGSKRITLSAELCSLNEYDEVLQTIQHEIAHAIAGKAAGHGADWERACALTGARPERCYSSAEVAQGKPPLVAYCSTCGKEFRRYRLTRGRQYACDACCDLFNHGRYSNAYQLTFTRE